MWYLLSLLIGWVLLDAILNIFPEKYTHWAVLGIMLLGWGTTLVWELPFSLSQGAVIVPYLYIGYLAKKNRWLDKPLPRRTLYILLGGTALTAVGALLAQSTDCISMGEWTLGPLSILLDAATGFLFIRLFMRLNRFTGPIAQGLQAIGRNSLNIFCIHTVELIAIPWYLFAAHFTDHPLRGMLLQNVIAFASIGLVCALLNLRRSWIVKASAARRQAQRRTPALSQH
jgi:fucose 4-O-acetylase and related acetyltransferases